MARIDQILIDRAWVYPKQTDIVHYIIKDIDDNEFHLVTPRKSKLGQKLEQEVVKLGKNIEAPSTSEDEATDDKDYHPKGRCAEYAYPRTIPEFRDEGECDTLLDSEGNCPNAHRHVDLRTEVD